jgi:6-phosphogluconolactonase
MNKVLAFGMALLILSSTAFSACNREKETAEGGPLYVMNNAAVGNSILVYERDENGELAPLGTVETQGMGAGSSLNPLGSQGALALTRDGKWLLAVNAGSNEISVMQVTTDGLKFASKTSSLGQFPVSLASYGNLVFVLNQKSSPPRISQFSLDKNGTLTSNNEATRLLPPGTYTQVQFSPNGKWLAISGESSNLILVYAINGNTISSDPITTESKGRGPAGLAFDGSGNLIVTESADNSVSSYSITAEGLKPISASVAGGQKSPRWIAVSGNFAYTVNSGSNNISYYSISTAASGQIQLAGTVASSGSGLTDIAASSDGRYIYALDPASHSIAVFRIGADGALTSAGAVQGLFGISTQGIAVS